MLRAKEAEAAERVRTINDRGVEGLNDSNEVETADGNPMLFDSGEPSTVALLSLWTEGPGDEGIFRSGLANTGLRGRHRTTRDC